jgi:hypothetical protein
MNPARVSVCLAMASCLAAGRASALGDEGSPIDTSDYTIDFYQGPILASSRTIALAGSFAALTEGVIGYAVNPASVAMRVPWSSTWFDWELDGSITSAASISNTDFDNNGDGSFADDEAIYVALGGGLQYGEIGVGLSVDTSEHRVNPLVEGSDAAMNVDLSRVDLVFGNMFLGGQLAVGAGLGLYATELSPGQDGGDAPPSVAVDGGAFAFGLVWLPVSLPLRAGASMRLNLPDDQAAPDGVSPDAEGNYATEGFVFPRRIDAPTQFHLAVATQLFAPLNAPWRIPGRRAKPPPREASEYRPGQAGQARLLLSTALEVTLPTRDGVGIESFLRQRVERSGERTSFSPRFGVEGEVVPGFLVLRSGTYREPTRFRRSFARWHGTGGFDLHVPIRWSVFGLFDENTTFRVGGAVDRAARYFGWSAGLGIWH